ncbi:helix-turn-helix domain-containing protein [Bacillus thuringiensis]|uniref:helix-turn-helix domain-containing protein n=1 Tax=Bacillus thuringiensis TaxID=1428 RepID=UPI002AB55808|nr:winged helix-turn-helix domain-containing protein [Bacillus thuringiensis]MDY7965619.1 winged helix-turn-helix domain-containing protein [Bacillus thuringiensis]
MAKLHVSTKYGMTVHDLLQEERKIKNSFFKQRLMSVRLVMEGHSATSAAQIIGICRQSVSTYVQTFNSDGIEGLLERRYPPGRTPYLSSGEETEIRNMLIESTPNQEGIGPETHWDTRVLQYLLEDRYHVSMSRGGICDMLHRWGFTYTRPTYRLKKADPLKQQKFLRELNWIKKTYPKI